LRDASDEIARGLVANSLTSGTSTVLVSSSVSAIIGDKSPLNAQAIRVAYGESTSDSLPRRASAAAHVDDELLELLTKKQ
jgi:hypothetical protein